MSAKSTLTLARGVAAGCLALFAFARSADAAYWQGDFDPLFFMGTAVFDVPVTCYGTGFVEVGTGSCLAGSVDLVSASVRDYAPGPTPPAPIDELFWGAFPGSVKGLFWDAGGTQLLGVDLYPSIGPSSAPTTGAYFPPTFRYYLTFYTGQDPTPPATPPATGVALYPGYCYSTGSGTVCIPSSEAIDVATNITFRAIPEPAPLALISVALAGLAMVRRREVRAREE